MVCEACNGSGRLLDEVCPLCGAEEESQPEEETVACEQQDEEKPGAEGKVEVADSKTEEDWNADDRLGTERERLIGMTWGAMREMKDHRHRADQAEKKVEKLLATVSMLERRLAEASEREKRFQADVKAASGGTKGEEIQRLRDKLTEAQDRQKELRAELDAGASAREEVKRLRDENAKLRSQLEAAVAKTAPVADGIEPSSLAPAETAKNVKAQAKGKEGMAAHKEAAPVPDAATAAVLGEREAPRTTKKAGKKKQARAAASAIEQASAAEAMPEAPAAPAACERTSPVARATQAQTTPGTTCTISSAAQKAQARLAERVAAEERRLLEEASRRTAGGNADEADEDAEEAKERERQRREDEEREERRAREKAAAEEAERENARQRALRLAEKRRAAEEQRKRIDEEQKTFSAEDFAALQALRAEVQQPEAEESPVDGEDDDEEILLERAMQQAKKEQEVAKLGTFSMMEAMMQMEGFQMPDAEEMQEHAKKRQRSLLKEKLQMRRDLKGIIGTGAGRR
mmetsp:Transcript_101483/g.286265  ORF Transcript_101483/g.286265 Transcript_101483/m.286265 type:complete len:519 (-) Transcript_101483:107-1663(-)